MNRKQSVRGFTLVELLVVIGIIGVLASLMLPSLAKARQAAQRTTCAATLKQLATAVTLYANDFKGARPLGNNPYKAGGANNVWVGSDFWPLYDTAGGTNISPDVVEYWAAKRILSPKMWLCPSVEFVGNRATALGGTMIQGTETVGTIECDYTYWGQTDIFYGGVAQNVDQPYPLCAFATQKLSARAPYGTQLVINRDATTGASAMTVNFKPGETSNLPLFSDATLRISGAAGFDVYSHGLTIGRCYTQTAYTDGHVESHLMNLNDPYFTINASGTTPINHYR